MSVTLTFHQWTFSSQQMETFRGIHTLVRQDRINDHIDPIPSWCICNVIPYICASWKIAEVGKLATRARAPGCQL